MHANLDSLLNSHQLPSILKCLVNLIITQRKQFLSTENFTKTFLWPPIGLKDQIFADQSATSQLGNVRSFKIALNIPNCKTMFHQPLSLLTCNVIWT